MSKLKELWAYVVAAIGVTIAGLVYYLTLKNKQINALKAEVDLADTKNKVTALESDIKNKRENIAKNAKEIAELDNTLESLGKKKKAIAVKEGAKTTTEIEEFWSK